MLQVSRTSGALGGCTVIGKVIRKAEPAGIRLIVL